MPWHPFQSRTVLTDLPVDDWVNCIDSCFQSYKTYVLHYCVGLLHSWMIRMTYVLVIYVNGFMLYLAVAPVLIYSAVSILYFANLHRHANFTVPLKFLSPYILNDTCFTLKNL